jgi:hypothetical protein
MQDFYSAVQHFIQGLRIMQQYGPRSADMPNLDLFIPKLCLSCPGNLSGFPVSQGYTHVVSAPVEPLPTSYHEVRLRLEAIAASINNHIKRCIERPTLTELDRERSSLLFLKTCNGGIRNLSIFAKLRSSGSRLISSS